jgi:hypothetical protein
VVNFRHKAVSPATASRPWGVPVSSDDSPPPGGSWLEANPSWLKVFGTTLELWLRRHAVRVPNHDRVSRRWLAAFFVAIVVVAGASSAAVTLAIGRHPTTGRPAHRVTTPPLTQAQAAAMANVRDAVAWMAAQVTTQTVVGCDPATCAKLEAAGFTTYVQLTGQTELERAATNLATGVPGTIAVVVTTPAVRARYGSQVAATAPAVLASFGAGQVAVQVRELTPGGAVAYPRVARRALAARQKAGLSLARNGQVHVHGRVRLALTSGLVDQRLTWLLGRIAVRYPVNVVRFGDAGPLAGRSAPLRMVEIGGFVVRDGSKDVSDLTEILKLLRGQPQHYLQLLTVVHYLGGAVTLKIQLFGPTPQ